MKTMKEYGMERLKTCAARLVRLLELNAPEMIIQREIHMLYTRSALISPDTWPQGLEDERSRIKVAAGFCGAHGCEVPLLYGDDRDAHPELGELLADRCLKCAQECKELAEDADEEVAGYIEDEGEPTRS